MDEDLKERLVSSEMIYAGQLVRLRVDRVQVPSGTVVIREVIEHPGSVVMVPLLEDGRVVMIRQFRQAVGEVLWELPAGTLRPGEDPEHCARRELIEEIGYEAGEMKHLFSTYLTPGYCNEFTHAYLARNLKEAPGQSEPDEYIRPVPMPLDDAVAMVLRGEQRNAQAIMGLLAAACLLKQEGGE